MKVLQINAVNGIKSTGRNTLELANFLNLNGHKAYIAYSVGENFEQEYKIGSLIDRKFHGLLSRVFGTQAYFSKRPTKNLLKYIEKVKPDVVHLGNLHSNFINLELLLTFLAENDIVTVLTLHDCWFYTGNRFHYTVDQCYSWKTGKGKCIKTESTNPSWFFDRSIKMLEDKKIWFNSIPRLGVIGVSDWITKESKKSILSSAKKITRIYNWVDFSIFKPVDTHKLEMELKLIDKFVLLGVASKWNNSKGLSHFLDLSKKITDNMVIILIGKIPKNTKLPGNVIHIKEINKSAELAKYYSLADVFLNLSLEESFGKVTAESLACGTPSIVINSTANPELIGKNCGYIQENLDLDNTIKYLNVIQKNGKIHYKQSCIKFARRNFNMEDRMQDHIAFYQSLLEEESIK